MRNKPIHVLGAGSIGILWTASIRSRFPNYPISLLLRDHETNRQKVNQSNCKTNQHLEISWNNRKLNESSQTLQLPVQFINDSKHQHESIQTLIVATKAHQAKQAVESVLDRLLVQGKDTNDSNDKESTDSSSSTQIILLCNGALSVREELSKLLPTQQLSLATTTHGAYLESPHKLVHAGVGTTFLEDRCGAMVDLWNDAKLECSAIPSQQMESILWNKLAANCVINPLTSIYKCTNGELLMEPSFFELQESILTEIATVATELSKQQPQPQTNQVPTMDEMRDFVRQTIQATTHNKSSMYQDVHMHHQTTEINHLNGFVVRKGRQLGTECPANEDLCGRIAELTAQTANKS